MIIAICGPAGAGKDSVANHLVKHYGFTVVKFAAKLKDVVADVFGFDRERLDDDLEYKESHQFGLQVTPRQVLQHIGTEGFRAMDEDVWVDYAMREAAKHERVVMPDTRFLNEARAVRAAGGSIWRVEKAGGPGTEHQAHASEVEATLIEHDRLLSAAHGELPKLYRAVDEHMGGVLGMVR